MKVGVVQFPGTNCDQDVYSFVALGGHRPEFLWHLDQFEVKKYDALILPGGFSFGDYLRSGALAARSPVMKSVREFSERGGPVLGICNGFQILTEAQLLPGALLKNEDGRFKDEWVTLQVVNRNQAWGADRLPQQLQLPVAHGDGRFFAPPDELKALFDQGQVWLQYQPNSNPNGSLENIAGVMNKAKNVAALMPHPERAAALWMGGTHGLEFLP